MTISRKDVDWFGRLPGFRRSPPGLEWALWQRLPALFGWGTALPVLVGLVFWATSPAADESALQLAVFQLIGLVAFIWTLLLTVAIGCIIVMLMKGPAYVADGADHPETRLDGGTDD